MFNPPFYPRLPLRRATRPFAVSLLGGALSLAGCAGDDGGHASSAGGAGGSGGTHAAGGGGMSAIAGSGGDGAASGAAGGDGSGGSGEGDDASATDAAGAATDPDAGGDDAATGLFADGGAGGIAGSISLFDGKTLDGWDGIPGIWSVKDGAIDGASNTTSKFPGTFLSSKGNFSDFRLVLRERLVQSENHLGICIWGSRLPAGSGGAGKCVVVIPPDGTMWDYGKGAIHNTKVGNAMADKHIWHQVEILAHRAAGTILMAVNGVQVTRFQDPDPARFQNGPIRLQLHAWTGPQEVQYKDLSIEVDPMDDRLITLGKMGL
jgi:hypothetical protein